MSFRTLKKNIFLAFLLFLLISCGDKNVLSLFAPDSPVITNSLGQTLLQVDHFVVIGTATGVLISTNQTQIEFHSVASGVNSIAADSYGNIYYTLNLLNGANCAISTNMFISQTIDSYDPNHFSLALTCDNSGYSYSLQAGVGLVFNNTGLNRGTGYLELMGYLGSSSGLDDGTYKSALALNYNGTLVIGNTNGSVYSSTDHGESFFSQVAWSGTSISNIAVSPEGVIVLNSYDKLKTSNNSYFTTTVTGPVTALSFVEEILYIGMDNGDVGISTNYGLTIFTNSSIGLGSVIAVGETRAGGVIAVTANGSLANILISTNGLEDFSSIFSTNAGVINDADIVF